MRALMHREVLVLAGEAGAPGAREYRLGMLADGRGARVRVEPPRRRLRGVPPGLIPDVHDPVPRRAARFDELDLMRREPRVEIAAAGHESLRPVGAQIRLRQRRERREAGKYVPRRPRIESAPRLVRLRRGERLVERAEASLLIAGIVTQPRGERRDRPRVGIHSATVSPDRSRESAADVEYCLQDGARSAL